MLPIRIDVGDTVLHGALDDTEAGRIIARALPLTSEFAVWGDELHFHTPLTGEVGVRPDPRVRTGDLALMTGSSTICVFFGPTPMSAAEEPVAAGPVVVAGRVNEPERLRRAKDAASITVTLLERAGDE